MRTLYQVSPWKADASPVFHSHAFNRHTPERLGDPSAFFSKAPFIPTRPVGAPIIGVTDRTLIMVNERNGEAYDSMALDMDEGLVEGVDITRPICRCKFAHNGAELGQSCSAPTAGGGGSASFGAGGEAASGGPSIGTIAIGAGIGVGVLLLLGIL